MRRLVLSLGAILYCAVIGAAGIIPVAPQCCFMDNPIGIETPSFGWRLEGSGPGAVQSAYEIQVASSPRRLSSGKADIWSSGKVLSDCQFGIRPEDAGFASATTYWWRVRVWDADGKKSSWTAPASFSMGLKDEDWKGEWIAPEWKDGLRMPYIRKEFKIGKGVSRATAFVCGLGAADLFVNGEYADSTRILDPAQTNYEHYALYGALDVTRRLKPGLNCLGVMLYDGWFNQNYVFTDFSYGKPMLRLQLVVEYADGKWETIVSDESWSWTEGPVVKANIYSGEVYDARFSVKDWSKPGIDESLWKSCVRATVGVPPSLRSQIMPAIRQHEVIQAKKMWKTAEGTYIYDLGTNNTANIFLRLSLPAGTKVTVRTGEEVYGEGLGVDFRSTGISVVPVQTDEYICAGSGVETWTPRGTYHGFRYAELSCDAPGVVPALDWLQAVLIHTDLPKTAVFNCSEPQLNRLHEMALRTVQGNIVGVPMDCPTREKCGWLGDSHAYIKMAMVGYDMDNFLMKYLEDIRSGADVEEKNTLHHQLKNVLFYYTDKARGIPYMIAPGKRLCGVASPDWGTAVVQLPWHIYLYGGNKAALEENYPMMAQWTDYITSISVGHIVFTGLGDWDPPYGVHKIATPVELTSTAFHYYDLTIMEQVAGILGKTSDRDRFAAEKKAVGDAFRARFYNPLAKTFGTQTADAMALDFGLCPEGEEADVATGISKHMVVQRHFFDVGIFGISRIGSALARNGQAKLAYDTFMKKGPYSFEWMWSKNDATTLWEVLPICDGNKEETNGCSHSHPMQAGFDIYFYEDLAGIRPVADAPGYKKIRFTPGWLGIDLESASASIESRYGRIGSSWEKKDGAVTWTVTVPAGCSGVVSLAGSKDVEVCPGEHVFKVSLREK
ncbi:MAG: family 78 glycoside hydrolase catalytic domain [Bacteroidales bacterium]|nr:family 78 glycoside hydrolase catalytic domain [Bacteroidales bacterium]